MGSCNVYLEFTMHATNRVVSPSIRSRRVASNSQSRQSNNIKSAIDSNFTREYLVREVLGISNGFGRKSEVSTIASNDERTPEDGLMQEKLNPLIVEEWITATLENAKYLDIPGNESNSTS